MNKTEQNYYEFENSPKKLESEVSENWLYLKALTFGPWPSKKADSGLVEKADPIPKFTVWVKDSFLTYSRVLISNMTIVS